MWSSHVIQKTNIQKTQFKIIKNLPGPTLYSVFILTAQKCARRKITILLFSKKRTRAGWLAYVVSPLLFADFLFPLFYHQICEIYLLSFIVPSLSTRVPGQTKVYSYLYSLFPIFFRLCSSLDFILLLFPHPLFPLSVCGISPFFICCVFALSCCPLRSE